jgi:hypothetical protein
MLTNASFAVSIVFINYGHIYVVFAMASSGVGYSLVSLSRLSGFLHHVYVLFTFFFILSRNCGQFVFQVKLIQNHSSSSSFSFKIKFSFNIIAFLGPYMETMGLFFSRIHVVNSTGPAPPPFGSM